MSTSRLIRPAAASLLSMVAAGSLVLLATTPAASSVAQPGDTGVQAPSEVTQLPALVLAPLAPSTVHYLEESDGD